MPWITSQRTGSSGHTIEESKWLRREGLSGRLLSLSLSPFLLRIYGRFCPCYFQWSHKIYKFLIKYNYKSCLSFFLSLSFFDEFLFLTSIHFYISSHISISLFLLHRNTYFLNQSIIWVYYQITKIWFRSLNILKYLTRLLGSSRKAWLLTTTLVIRFPFSLPLKKRGKKKRRMNSKNCDQKSCLSARSSARYQINQCINI